MKVIWDDEIPNVWENKKWQPNHQPGKNLETLKLSEVMWVFSPAYVEPLLRLKNLTFHHVRQVYNGPIAFRENTRYPIWRYLRGNPR